MKMENSKLRGLALYTALFGLLFLSACDDDREFVAPNAIVGTLEDGIWRIYDASDPDAYDEGEFTKGVKVNTWLHVNSDTSFKVDYKRNPVIAKELRLGVPVRWREISVSGIDFVALDTVGRGNRTVIVNTITAASDTVSIESFSKLALSGLTQWQEYEELSCTSRKVSLTGQRELVLVKATYTDTKEEVRKTYRCAYIKVESHLFIDASVSGPESDSSAVVNLFNDFVSNIVYDTTKLLPYHSDITRSRQIGCF